MAIQIEQMLSAARSFIASNDQDAAIEKLQAVVKHDENCLEAQELLGSLALQQRDFVTATNAFERVTQSQRGSFDAWRNFGIALMHTNRHRESLDAFRKGLRINSQSSELYYYSGVVYELMSELDMARSAYREAIRLNPGFALVHCRLATIAFKRKMYSEAIRGFRRVLEIDPSMAAAIDGLREAESAARKSQAEDPFGRLVDTSQLRKRRADDGEIALSPEERESDRADIRRNMKTLIHSASEYQQFLETEVVTTLRDVARGIASQNRGEVMEVLAAWEKFREVARQLAQIHRSHETSINRLDAHESVILSRIVKPAP